MQQFLHRAIPRSLSDIIFTMMFHNERLSIPYSREEKICQLMKNSCNNFCNYVEWWFFTRTYNVRTYSSNCACYLERRMMMLDSQCYLNAREKKICQSKNSCNNFSLALIVTIFLNRIYSQWCWFTMNDSRLCIIWTREKRKICQSMNNSCNNFYNYIEW